jgi:GTP pyrophosphokinase
MVAVRKSHQMSETNFDSWLLALALGEVKQQAIEACWTKVHPLYNEHLDCQAKALEMVEILASLNMDKDSLVAAMLVPLFEKAYFDLETIEQDYSSAVSLLVKGVSQMDAIRLLQQGKSNDGQVDNIRRMLLAMVKDVRSVVIKLAERVCNLRMVKNAAEEERVIIAKETAAIYAPLANRLGIGQLKWELEDISFRAEQHVKSEVDGRPKHIYSIWKKMHKKDLTFEQLFDVRAVRIIVDKLQDCYSALGVVHTLFRHLPNEFDDYVATPKPNGYQSIHTVVLGPQGKAVEVQIRTRQMHQDAELGVAAHWRYKEGSMTGKSGGFDEKINWLRKILQWQEDVSESGGLVEELRSQVFEDRIYVFTPNGDVIDMPTGATPLDFAYYIHSNVGHCCIGAKISGRIVPFTYRLQTGDQVEILTSKSPNPSRDWLNPSLNYLHTSRARSKVQSYFKSQDKDKNMAAGKELLEKEFTKLGVCQPDLAEAVQRFNMHNANDLYAAIGAGDIRLLQVVNFIQNKHKKSSAFDPLLLLRKESSRDSAKVDKNGITVSGVGNLLTHLAKCCQPLPGDEILGFITQGRGISVHRSDCEQLKHALQQSPEREVEVQWGGESKLTYPVTLQIIAGDRQGLLRDITTIIANEKMSVLGMESLSDSKQGTVKMSFKLEVTNLGWLSKLIAKFEQVEDVISVVRLNS